MSERRNGRGFAYGPRGIQESATQGWTRALMQSATIEGLPVRLRTTAEQPCARIVRLAASLVRCIACSHRRLLALATGCALVAAFGSPAADPRSAEVEELLSEAARASSDGDFETAWASHRRAWTIAVASREAGAAMLAYCERHDCPKIRKTGWLLGKPDSDLRVISEACRGRESEACRR